MKKGMKLLLIILIAMYVISPVDLVAGPIDDIVVTLLGMAAMKGRAGC